MFLATTALEEFWDKNQKILFLGEWCKLYKRKKEWENLDYEVLPYHWDDREQLYKDYQYLRGVYEQYLEALSDRLNAIHGVSHSHRYWRILIGPWLYSFIQILFDRFLSIMAAADSKKVHCTWICPNPNFDWTPTDMDMFQTWFMMDGYNHYLYSRIINYCDNVTFETITPADGWNLPPPETENRSSLRKIIDLVYKLLPNDIYPYVLIASYLKIKDIFKLHMYLGQIPYLGRPEVSIKRNLINHSERDKIKFHKHDQEFEALLDAVLPEQIPTVYLEDYHSLNHLALHAYPQMPRLIFTANSHHANEGFKFWAAHHVERSVPLVVSQHGGLHGSGLLSTNEEHEIRISDSYLTWGWGIEGNYRVIPMASGKLWGECHRASPDRDGPILWVGCSGSRYSYNLLSMMIGPQAAAHFDDQRRFLHALHPEARRLLLLRLYLNDYGWDQEQRWRDMAPDLKLYKGNKLLIDQMNESRLCICTYNATTYLEAFVNNFPTVMFWNPLHWEIRDQARPYFDGLIKGGILHYSPESAAELVNRIHEDPMAWWQNSEVQEAKDRFCWNFARTHKDWYKAWASFLRRKMANH